jgi:hypothetical protein
MCIYIIFTIIQTYFIASYIHILYDMYTHTHTNKKTRDVHINYTTHTHNTHTHTHTHTIYI